MPFSTLLGYILFFQVDLLLFTLKTRLYLYMCCVYILHMPQKTTDKNQPGLNGKKTQKSKTGQKHLNVNKHQSDKSRLAQRSENTRREGGGGLDGMQPQLHSTAAGLHNTAEQQLHSCPSICNWFNWGDRSLTTDWMPADHTARF